MGRPPAPLERPGSCPGWPNSPPPRQAAGMPRPGVGSPSSPSVLLLAKDCTPWTYGPSGPGEVGSRYRHPPQRPASGRAATRRNNLRKFSQTKVMPARAGEKATPPPPSKAPAPPRRPAGSPPSSCSCCSNILATLLLHLLLEDLRHVARCLGPRRLACGRIFLLAAIGFEATRQRR